MQSQAIPKKGFTKISIKIAFSGRYSERSHGEVTKPRRLIIALSARKRHGLLL